MPATSKQKQEIDFLIKYFDGKEEDTEQYLNWVVFGKDKGDKFDKNTLFQSKRRLDMNIKMWTEDMKYGLLAYWELLEDFDNCNYIKKVINSIRKKIIPLPYYDGLIKYATLGYLNSKFYLKKELEHA